MTDKIFWFWLPIVFFMVQILIEIFVPHAVLEPYLSENGPYEFLQFFVLIIAFLIALKILLFQMPTLLFHKIWFALAAICCFYVAGEEVSWGQHLVGWSTPENWQEVNDQGETNLHNTSSWFDQKPRLILILGIVIGSILYPVLRSKNLIKLPTVLESLMPSRKLFTIALLVVLPQLIEKIFEAFDIMLFSRFSEIQELYIFYYILLYLIFAGKNIQANYTAKKC